MTGLMKVALIGLLLLVVFSTGCVGGDYTFQNERATIPATTSTTLSNECINSAVGLSPEIIYLSTIFREFPGEIRKAKWRLRGVDCENTHELMQRFKEMGICNKYRNFWKDGTIIENSFTNPAYNDWEKPEMFESAHVGNKSGENINYFYIELGRNKSKFIDENGFIVGELESWADFTLKPEGSIQTFNSIEEVYFYHAFEVLNVSIVSCNLVK